MTAMRPAETGKTRQRQKPPREGFAIEEAAGPAGRTVWKLAGRLDSQGLKPLAGRFNRLLKEKRSSSLQVDLAQVNYLDSAGALALMHLETAAEGAGLPLSLVNLNPRAQRIKSLIKPELLDLEPLIQREQRRGLATRAGDATYELMGAFENGITFVGQFAQALHHAVVHPRLVRWGNVLRAVEGIGVDGLPIVGLLSFLLGLVIAFMSALQLKSFGANIFVADLVALAMTRELGPIMVGILIAGRSGASFAAEIGTMKINEEIDALVVMGYNPVGFLVIPKVIASLVVVPMLTLYANFLGIAGGVVVGVVALNLTVYTYVQETLKILDTWDVTSGLIKSLVFGVIIVGVGCQRGFSANGGAAGVGRATTSAVVTSISLIIVANAVFALIYYVDW